MPTGKELAPLVRYVDGVGNAAITRARKKEVAPEKDLLEEVHVLPETMVVTEADKRFEAALSLTVEDPTEFIRGQRRAQPPLVKGARVSVETMLGFLEALSALSKECQSFPSKESVKVSFRPGDEPRVFIEGGVDGIWTAVAIRAESSLKEGFDALLPLERGINVLSTESPGRGVVIGVDKKGFCLGSHSVPFGGKVQDFPSSPAPLAPMAKGALPMSCCQEISSRVARATHPKTLFGNLHSLLLDFDVYELEGGSVVMGTVVATDGCRMHILQLPRMQMKIENGRLPPAIRVPPAFFSYLSSVVESKGAVLEFRDDQIVAKGVDFMVRASATVEKQSEPTEVGRWRSANVSYGGYWMIDSTRIEAMLASAGGEFARIRLDGMYEEMTVSSKASDGSYYEEQDSSHVSNFAGATVVNVLLDRKYLLDAIKACSSSQIRMEFEHDTDKQPQSPVVIRGEDEQFRAVVMPAEEDE